MRWDQGRFAVERECTCKVGQRSAECREGWHMVDSHNDGIDALSVSIECARLYGFRYRVKDTKTGEVVS